MHLIVFGYLLDFRLEIGAKDEGRGGFEVGLGLALEPVAAVEEQSESAPSEPEPEPIVEEVVAEEPVEELPEPVAEIATTPTPIKVAEATETTSPEPPNFTVQPSSTESASPRNASSGRSRTPAFGGEPGIRDIYIARLSARLNRFKYYPMKSLRNREEGVAVLLLVLNRQGRVLESSIAESSGFEELDRAALRIVNNAKPLPRFDRRIEMAQLRVRIPMTFDIAR